MNSVCGGGGEYDFPRRAFPASARLATPALFDKFRPNVYNKIMNATFQALLFDLDGTLTDPFEGITDSIVYALGKFGIAVNDKRPLTAFIGPPLVQSFSEYYGFSHNDALKAVEYYREYFADKGIFENAVYDGVLPMLETLKAHRYRLYIATSKPEVFAKRIAAHFGMAELFDGIAGATLDTTRNEKADVIAYALRTYAVAANSALMIGDRRHDILGAKANGLRSMGVLYGYGSEEELRNAGADMIATSPQTIAELLL